MSRLTVILPLLLLLLGGCGATPESSADPETSQEQTVSQSASPPSTVSQVVTDANGGPDESLDQDGDESQPDGEGIGAKPVMSDATSAAGRGNGDRPTPAKVPEAEGTAPAAETTRGVPADTTIVPGERLGAVTPTTTYGELVAEFGADRLSDTEVHLGEGFMAAATRVDLGEDYSFSVVWTDGDRTAPLEIREIGPGWQTPEGIHSGMTFNQLEEILGEFQLLGFGWDYSGTILLEDTPIAAYSGKIYIRVAPSVSDWEAKGDQLIKVSGDQAFSSTDPNFDGIDIKVQELVVNLNSF